MTKGHPRDVNADDWRKYELEGEIILLDQETVEYLRGLKDPEFIQDDWGNILALQFSDV